MWDFAPDGEVYYEKFLHFAKTVFEQWRALDVSHSLSVVFFTRVYYYQLKGGSCGRSDGSSNVGSAGGGSNVRKGINIDGEGRMYKDFYKMVLENETRNDNPPEKVSGGGASTSCFLSAIVCY